MRFWEENKWLVGVVGGFLAVYLLLAFIVFLPNAAAVRKIEAGAKRDYGTIKAQLFPRRKHGKEKLKDLLYQYRSYNTALDNRLIVLEKMVSRPFADPLVPAVDYVNFGSGVRTELGKRQQEIMLQAGNRGVTMLEGAQSLIGRELPAALTETLPTDIDWLQQIRVAYEFASLLLKLSSTGDGKLCLKEIQSLKTFSRQEIFLKAATASKKAEATGAFLNLYPLSAQLLVSPEGLMRILDACSRKETFFVIRGMAISSAPDDRKNEPREQVTRKNLIGRQQVTRWNEYYYVVNLEVARLKVNLGEVAKPGVISGPSGENALEPQAKTGVVHF